MSHLLIMILGSLLTALIVFVLFYNRINEKRNQIDNAFSSLDALFIKRNDLIPNLISIVKQYMAFEQSTLEKITAMRKPNDTTSEAYLKDGEASGLLRQIMIQVENYPDLKANTQFTLLQFGFNECEEQIAAGRRYLSASITDYNNSVTTFPGNVIASIKGNKKHEWEKATDLQRQNLNANNLFNN